MATKAKPKPKTKVKNAKPKPKTKVKNAKVSLSPTTDKEWQIQSDARTLKEAMAIQTDQKRLKDAQAYVSKEMEAMQKISKMK